MTNTSTTPGFSCSRHDGVVTIQLTRVEQHNRIDPADLAGLRETIASAGKDETAIALVVTGTGAATFSSGYTLSALAEGNIDDSFESFLNELEACPCRPSARSTAASMAGQRILRCVAMCVSA